MTQHEERRPDNTRKVFMLLLVTGAAVSVLLNFSNLQNFPWTGISQSKTNSESKPMPIPLSDWANIAAVVSAMCDVITTGRDTFNEFFARRAAAPDLQQRANLLKNALSTYSDREVEAIKNRLEGCRERFVEQGGGMDRKKCLCSVLKEVKDGNGGSIPFEDWEQVYETLGCDRQ